MDCDYTDPGGTPLERLTQQQAGNHPAPCARSCEANAYEIQIRQLSSERDAMAAKLAELEGQEPVAWMTANREMTSFVNFHDDDLPLYARPAPAGPVNARLLDVATGKTPHLYEGRCPDYVNGPESRDPDCPACQAIVSADAQQERLLQDMHDAGREIDRVMAEATPKAARLTDEEIASLLAASDKNSPRVPSFFMTEPHKFARAIETAVLRKNGIEVAE